MIYITVILGGRGSDSIFLWILLHLKLLRSNGSAVHHVLPHTPSCPSPFPLPTDNHWFVLYIWESVSVCYVRSFMLFFSFHVLVITEYWSFSDLFHCTFLIKHNTLKVPPRILFFPSVCILCLWSEVCERYVFPPSSSLKAFVFKMTSYVSPSVLVSYCCLNKLPQNYSHSWVGQTSEYSMALLGPLLRVTKVWNQDVSRVAFLSRGSRVNLLWSALSLLARMFLAVLGLRSHFFAGLILSWESFCFQSPPIFFSLIPLHVQSESATVESFPYFRSR